MAVRKYSPDIKISSDSDPSVLWIFLK